MLRLLTPCLLGACLLSSGWGADSAERFDVVVYGATPSGVSAAVNAARSGVKVALVQEDGHIGGLTAGGLSNPDFQSFEALGGTWREFLHRVEKHYEAAYGAGSAEVVNSVRGAYSEPKVARRVFEDMLAEQKNLRVFFHHRLAKVATTASADGRRRPTSATFTLRPAEREVEIRGAVFIDSTYEGDLMALAGATYRVGCESKAEFGESLAPEEANPYVMTYNFRVCLTTDRNNFIPIPRPAHYRREDYAPLIRLIAEGKIKSLCNPGPPPAILRVRPMPNQKADWNDDAASPISLSLENVNQPWPEGSAADRARVFETYRNHSLGLFWFLGHDPEVPESFRREMNCWGLPRDEYPDTGHWTPALYVREARRLVGEYVFTEKDTQPAPGSVRAPVQRDSVAIGDYSLVSHGVHSPEPGVTIGRFGKVIRPYQIPYGVLLPKNVDGLLVSAAVSASHVGFSALRMEPSWVGLGQAAGLAAALAVKSGGEVRDVSVPALQHQLWQRGAMTIYATDLTPVIQIPRPAWDPPGTFPAALQPWPVTAPFFHAAQYFGTRGFFQDLIDPRTARDTKRPGATGQWRGAYPHHAIGLELPIDRELAVQWSRLAGTELAADLAPDGRLTRGAFLNRLLARVAPARPAPTSGRVDDFIRRAGNSSTEEERLQILREFQRDPGLADTLQSDLRKVIEHIALFAHNPSLTYFGRNLREFERVQKKSMDYDFGLSPGSVLEPLTWLYRGRMITWLVIETPRGRERELLGRAREFFERTRAAFPGNRIAAMYLGQPQPAPRRYEAPPSAPAWAVHQREGIERLTDVIEWWIDHRMQADGQFGGGWGDDCEMWRWWVPVLLGFDTPKITAAQARFSQALLSQPHMREGYSNLLNDVEHSAEDSADAMTPMMHLDPDNPVWRDRALRLATLMETLWTGRNERGQLMFKSTFFSVDQVDENPRHACDTLFHPRAMQPALLYWQRTGDPRLTTLFTAWMDTWVAAAMSTERGKPAGVIPSAIHWPDGRVGGLGPEWWDPQNYEVATLYRFPNAMSLMLHTQLLTWHMTYDERYLGPIRAMAALRLKFLRGQFTGPVATGGEAWCASQISLSGVLAKYKFLTDSGEFDDLLALEKGSSFSALGRGDRTPLVRALERTAGALAINFEGYTSEVRYTDRVLRFPALFADNGMYEKALGSFSVPSSELLYSTVTGDPGDAMYCPLNAVRWLTPSRDIAALVTNSSRSGLSAELYHFGAAPRAMAAELFLLGAGDYTWELQGDASLNASGQLTVKGPRTRVPFSLPPKQVMHLTIRRSS